MSRGDCAGLVFIVKQKKQHLARIWCARLVGGSQKAGGTKVWTMSREHARVFFLVRILLVRSQKYRQTMSRVNACS